MSHAQANGFKKKAMGLKIDRPKTTDDWQEAQDATADREGIEDRLDALAGDEPPRVLSTRLNEAEKASGNQE